MNLKITTLLVSAFLSSTCFATQTLRCHFVEGNNPDSLMVSLTNDQAGSLVYATGTGEDTSSSADGNLSVKRIDVGNKDIAGFGTQVEAMQMIFKMPTAQVLKPSGSFKGVLSTRIDALNSSQDQDLNCDAAASARAQ